MYRKFPIYRQLDIMDCAPTCLRMVCAFYGKNYSLDKIRNLCDKDSQGVTLYGIHRAAEELGLKSSAHKMSINIFLKKATTPCIIHWKGDHFVVVYKIKKKSVYIADPAVGKLKVNLQEFQDFWTIDGTNGYILILDATENFCETDEEKNLSINGLKRLSKHVLKHRRLLAQVALGSFLGSILNLIFPFLTQALVDNGIGNRDIGLVWALLLAQIMLFLGRTATEFIRSWIVVHIGTRVNVAVISDFLMKLMRLPLSYFEKQNLGDILQRVADHQKIEEFLSFHSLSIIFSSFNLIVFSVILGIYSPLILCIFLVGTFLSIIWILLFINKRKIVDYQKFRQQSRNQNVIMQLVQGMSELKINQGEEKRRREWEDIQGNLFNVKLRALAIEQYQQAGNLFVNEIKNICITFVAAYLVISGEITLGIMMSITYILGQMNAPVEQLIIFFRLAQDAKISMDRLGEVQQMRDETIMDDLELVTSVPIGNISLENINFKYGLHDRRYTLEGVSLHIPEKRMTAIVGASGSGKTTLMKLLLGIQKPESGNIRIGSIPLNIIHPSAWREKCGVVLQDGFIFSDSIASNIAMTHDKIDFERVFHAAKIANIHSEIEILPQGYMTKIGRDGLGISGGQKQRVLIARAVYKNPEYIFLDEATSALDSDNERAIQDNLIYFLKGRTSVVIAHRLSTVKHADQIVVLRQGNVVEIGNHDSLTLEKGFYYNLVKNQLELGA